MKVREMPWFDRPGVRLKRNGVQSLSDAELLAVVLWRGDQKENIVDMSHRLLARFNYNKLEYLSLAELSRECNDEIKAMKIQAMFEVFRRKQRLTNNGFTQSITSAKDVFNYFIDRLVSEKKELFFVLCLDTKNRIIEESLVSVGILDASLIHPREVFNAAVRAHAKSIVLVHNHPSGETAPSDQDEKVTLQLKNAGELLGIEVLDHVIVGSNKYMSMKETGIL
jgi:DNA repair protein RadC